MVMVSGARVVVVARVAEVARAVKVVVVVKVAEVARAVKGVVVGKVAEVAVMDRMVEMASLVVMVNPVVMVKEDVAVKVAVKVAEVVRVDVEAKVVKVVEDLVVVDPVDRADLEVVALLVAALQALACGVWTWDKVHHLVAAKDPVASTDLVNSTLTTSTWTTSTAVVAEVRTKCGLNSVKTTVNYSHQVPQQLNRLRPNQAAAASTTMTTH